MKPCLFLGGRFGFFKFLFLSLKFCSGARRGGVGLLLKIPGGGGSPRREGGEEGVCGELGRGGLNILFRGRNARQALQRALENGVPPGFLLLHPYSNFVEC